jgi:four helix bundle protein
MTLIVHTVAVEAIATLRPIVRKVAARDRNLADQLRRAASSMLLNIAEAEGSDAGNARARLHTAAAGRL